MDTTFEIFTDTSCDLPAERLEALEVTCMPIGLVVDGEDYLAGHERLPSVDEFYELQVLHKGATTTSGLTQYCIMEAFEKTLKAGKDILYLGIVPDLSEATWNSMYAAVAELREKYPERRIETPNTHAIAPGLGLLIDKMVEELNLGADLDKMLGLLDYWSRRAAHWFTVDNFDQLKRSGRVSNIQALVAGILSIKPVMRLPYEGKLESVAKVRGNKAILHEFVNIVNDSMGDPEGEIRVSYGGACQRDRAEALVELIRQILPEARMSLHRIGPIIGAHTGRTVLAIFFFGRDR